MKKYLLVLFVCLQSIIVFCQQEIPSGYIKFDGNLYPFFLDYDSENRLILETELISIIEQRLPKSNDDIDPADPANPEIPSDELSEYNWILENITSYSKLYSTYYHKKNTKRGFSMIDVARFEQFNLDVYKENGSYKNKKDLARMIFEIVQDKL